MYIWIHRICGYYILHTPVYTAVWALNSCTTGSSQKERTNTWPVPFPALLILGHAQKLIFMVSIGSVVIILSFVNLVMCSYIIFQLGHQCVCLPLSADWAEKSRLDSTSKGTSRKSENILLGAPEHTLLDIIYGNKKSPIMPIATWCPRCLCCRPALRKRFWQHQLPDPHEDN